MFVELSKDLKLEAVKVLQRVKDPRFPKAVNLNSVKVAFLIDPDQKYTVCLLKTGRVKKQELTAGVAKRATYAGMADDYSEETGRSIAFSRAIRNFALGIEGAFVTL